MSAPITSVCERCGAEFKIMSEPIAVRDEDFAKPSLVCRPCWQKDRNQKIGKVGPS